MPTPTPIPTHAPSTPHRPWRVGCVSYLNAAPLIDGLDETLCEVLPNVPARLLDDLLAERCDVVLCPVVDYFRSPVPLEIVPAGAIGSDGETLTVRLYAQQPIASLDAIHVDPESHTSIALLRVLLQKRHGLSPKILPYDLDSRDHPPAMLLIGDKVIARSPEPSDYPYQLDLGREWREWTGLPFVFATWFCRAGTALGDLPRRLDAQRRCNAGRLAEIAQIHAARHGWPVDVAEHYLTRRMCYTIGDRELNAIRHFATLARRVGAIEHSPPLTVRPL